MDLTRSWYGLGYIRIRMKQKNVMHFPFGYLALWQYGNFSNEGKAYLQYRI